ncbi:MAG TPA: hypothetical protein VM243_08385 [Phycisphaerae bacterium]|nr:hypothetical protein [Phycisphaerae bacterium]
MPATNEALTQYTATFDLVGLSPFSHSKPLTEKKKKGEADDDFENRIWRQRLHTNANDQVVLPAMMLKSCLAGLAQYRSERIPGKGQQTYSKNFLAAVMCFEDMPLLDAAGTPLMAEHIEGERLFLNADGKRGGGVRVWRIYPRIPEGWKATAKVLCVDGLITPAKLEEYAKDAGLMIGFGRFRPRNGGHYGRFKIENFRHVAGLES